MSVRGLVVGLVAAVVLFGLSFGAAPVSAQTTGRNVLFIVVDDLRNWVGYTGDYEGTVHTPNIDALAAVSTRYLNAYASNPHCIGSRTSVMLGQGPATHGIRSANFVNGSYNALMANPQTVTLPEVMSQNGYHSAVAGKVFHNVHPDRWDESGPATIIASLQDPFDPGPDNTFINPQVLPETEEHPDQTVADWAGTFIDNYTASEPFFLAVGFYQPHLPWRVPQWAYDLYPPEDVWPPAVIADDLEDEPPQAVQYANNPMLYGVTPLYDAVDAAGRAADYTRAYLAAISHTDAMVGQVLGALANSVHAVNTDVILWSDNGFHLGEKRHWQKNTFWEEAVRVPLLVSAPGNADYPVGDVPEAVSLVDLAPTVLHLTGLPPFAGFEGAPLHDVGNRSAVEIFLNAGRATVNNGMKSIDYDEGVPGAADRASYDLVNDPNEITNLLQPPGC